MVLSWLRVCHGKVTMNKCVYSTSSKRWLLRQSRDPFVKAAKEERWRARSAFKLIMLNEKHRLIKTGDTIVDCGAAPGGWAQVAVSRANGGKVIAVDRLPIEPIPGVEFIQGDFLNPAIQDSIQQRLPEKAQLVMSDMAPSFSGNNITDHARSMELCESVLSFAKTVLAPGGHFIAKFLMGGTEADFRRALKTLFTKVKVEKPESSRKQSKEAFFVALGYKSGDKNEGKTII